MTDVNEQPVHLDGAPIEVDNSILTDLPPSGTSASVP